MWVQLSGREGPVEGKYLIACQHYEYCRGSLVLRWQSLINTEGPEHNGWYSADNSFKKISFNENFCLDQNFTEIFFSGTK